MIVITIIITITYLKTTCTQIVKCKIHVERREETELHTGFLLDNPKERDHLENINVGERIILKWIFKTLV